MLNPEEYLIRTVGENLEFLRAKWTQEIDDVSLRNSSAVLRILLTEDNLGRVWRLVGFKKEPTIVAPDLDAFLEGTPILRITFASAGGAVYRGKQVQGLIVYDTAMSDNYLKTRYELQRNNDRLIKAFPLSAFRESPCLLITQRLASGIIQRKIKRRELINYVANKLGGTHIDTTRDPTKEDAYILLDWARNQLRTSEKEAIYYELLSIGQHLINSPDIVALQNRISLTT